MVDSRTWLVREILAAEFGGQEDFLSPSRNYMNPFPQAAAGQDRGQAPGPTAGFHPTVWKIR